MFGFFHTSHRNTARGFTLVEMLVYMAILIVVSVAGVTTLLNLKQGLEQYRVQQQLSQAEMTINDRFLTDTRNATAIDSTQTTLTTSPGTLGLTSGATTTVFARTGSALTVTTNGGTPVALTRSGVTVDSLYFFTYANTHTTLARVKYTLTATAGTLTVTKTFTSSAVLRGTYD